MSEHTKGPWEHEPEILYQHRHHVAGRSPRVFKRGAGMGKTIAKCPRTHTRDGLCDEAEANARLIAAAPDLLDACTVALGHMTGGMDGDWRDCDPVDLLRKAVEKARPNPHGKLDQ